MPDLGKKYTCYSCHTKFYDLGKPEPICPKCGSDQRDAEEAPLITPSRGRGRSAPAPVIEEPDEEFAPEGEAAAPEAADEDEDIVPEPDREEPEEDEEEEEEY